MNEAPVQPTPLETNDSFGSGWPWRKMLFLIAFVFAVHLALISLFGIKKQIVPRVVSNVPHLQLTSPDDELIALGNPTLFALPNPRDFSSVIWSKIPSNAAPSFRWDEPPQWLLLAAESLGATLQQFSQTNRLAGIQLNIKPSPQLSEMSVPIESTLLQNSTLKIVGALAQRDLLGSIALPTLPYNNVLAPSKVQVLVNAAGQVISAILLPDNGSYDAAEHYDLADQRALTLARSLRFAHGQQLTLGEIIFNWRTVPLSITK